MVFLAALVADAQVQSITATIDASRSREPIAKYVYGQFIEHIAGTSFRPNGCRIMIQDFPSSIISDVV